MDYFNRRRMRLFWALLASAFLLIFAACGDDDPASGLDFESFLEDTSAAEGAVAEGDALIDSVLPNPYSRLDGHHERLVRVSYVHDMLTLVRETTTANRDIEGLVDTGRTNESGLDWVVAVHDMHRSSEELRFRAYAYEVNEVLVLDYVDFHASFLEGVQVFSQSADRLLQAAIVLGPSGRSVNDLSADVRSDYNSLVSEGGFFSQDTEVLLTRSSEDLQVLIQELRLR